VPGKNLDLLAGVLGDFVGKGAQANHRLFPGVIQGGELGRNR
jgi:hypothetical protein